MPLRRSYKSIAISACVLFFAALFLFSALAAYLFYFPQKYREDVTDASSAYGIEEELLFAVMRAESNFRPDAVSSAGAVGLMQLMPSTARFIERQAGFSCDLLIPAENIRAGAWYLRYLLTRFEGEREVLAAYNAGEGTVRSWLRDGAYSDDGAHLKGIPYAETARYVDRINFFRNCYKILY